MQLIDGNLAETLFEHGPGTAGGEPAVLVGVDQVRTGSTLWWGDTERAGGHAVGPVSRDLAAVLRGACATVGLTPLPAISALLQHGNKYFEKPGAQWGE